MKNDCAPAAPQETPFMTNNRIIPFPLKRQQSVRKQDDLPAGRSTFGPSSPTPGAESANATPRAIPGFLPDGPLASMLRAAGHSRACIMRLRSDPAMTCSCGADSEPVDEAAQAVGRAIRFARMAATRQVPIPRGVITAVVRQADAGNAAALLVWQWLLKRGQIPAGRDMRPKFRIVRKPS